MAAAHDSSGMQSDDTARSWQDTGLDHISWQSLVEQMGTAVCITRTNGIIVYVNTAACRLLGIDRPSQRIGAHIWDQFPREVVKAVRTRIMPGAASGTAWSGDIPLLTAEKHTVPTYACVTPVAAQNGKQSHIGWIFTDTSGNRRILSELTKSKDFLLNIVNTIGDPVIVKDMQGRVVLVNDSAAQLLGVPKKDIIGHTEHEFRPPEIAAEYVQSDQQVLDTGEDLSTESSVLVDGEKREYAAKKSRLVDPDTGQRFVVAALRDVTDIKAIERELITYREHLEELVAKRTDELQKAILTLEVEVAERKHVENSLRESELSVAEKARNLEETNIALKVLLDHQDEETRKLGETIAASVNNLIAPYLEKLHQATSDPAILTLAEIIATNLSEIMKPFAKDLSAPPAGLSATEIQVAKSTAEGKTAKEIADIMMVSENTVKAHKRNIRKKLGIRSSGANLRSYLQRLFDRGMSV